MYTSNMNLYIPIRKPYFKHPFFIKRSVLTKSSVDQKSGASKKGNGKVSGVIVLNTPGGPVGGGGWGVGGGVRPGLKSCPFPGQAPRTGTARWAPAAKC